MAVYIDGRESTFLVDIKEHSV